MSFSLLPIVPPVPAPSAGPATPPSSAAEGFGGLLAALFGGGTETHAQPLPAAQAQPGGKITVPLDEEEADPEAEPLVDALSPPDSQLALQGLQPPPPVPVAPQQTPLADAASGIPPVGGESQAVGDALLQTGQDRPAAGPALDGEVSPTTAMAVPDAAAGAADEAAQAPVMATRPTLAAIEAATAEDAKVDIGSRTAGDPAIRSATLAAAAPTALPAQPEPTVQPSAAPPTATAAAQAGAQPLMTAAVAAGVVSLKASQSDALSAPDAVSETTEDSEVAPVKAKPADAKSAFAAQAPSPFALTAGAAGPVAPKAEGPLAPALGTALAEASPPSSEGVATANLDTPDTPAPLASSPLGAAATEARDAGRPPATAATVADLAAQVSRRLEGRTTHFDIQLTPEGLGRVDVRVDIDAQGKLTAAMAFDNPHAANEMRGRSGDLLRALEQAGFDMSGGLSFSSPQDQRSGGQFADQAPDREAWQGRAFQTALGVADEAETAAGAARLYQQRRSSTGVDLRI